MGNMHTIIENQIDEAMIKVKYPKLKIVKGNIEYHYVCNTCEYNHWLNRYYPKADLILEVEHFNRIYK